MWLNNLVVDGVFSLISFLFVFLYGFWYEYEYGHLNEWNFQFKFIVGVNNHFQLILFGCALSGKETTIRLDLIMHNGIKLF